MGHAIVCVDRAPADRPTRQISIQVGASPGILPLNNVRLSYAFLPYNGSFFNLTSVVTDADRWTQRAWVCVLHVS